MLLRAAIAHTPNDPFVVDPRTALVSHLDGALVIHEGSIVACGAYGDVSASYPNETVQDLRPALVIPGLVDTHVHYPQTAVIGAMGLQLLDWLREHTLPTEARLHDLTLAQAEAHAFLQSLMRAGTTTALVFGAHQHAAQHAFFEAAAATRLRITSGQVLADTLLREDLRVAPERAFRECETLIQRWHGHERLRFAVTPRFALSASHAMMEVCGSLMKSHPTVLFQSHVNENTSEIVGVREAFSACTSYVDAYDRYGLLNERSVLAHNVHPLDAELECLSARRTTISHCPTSNAFLGSGLFPLRRHREHDVHVALGSDVGAGTGFSILKEALAAYQMQMLRPDGFPLSIAHLLYLATRAGAVALGLGAITGDFSVGRAADLVVLSPPPNSTTERAFRHAETVEQKLGVLFTLAREESVVRVMVDGIDCLPATDTKSA